MLKRGIRRSAGSAAGTSIKEVLIVAIAGAVSFGAGSVAAAPWSMPVEEALSEAGENRPALESVLYHFLDGGDAKKLEAAEFLIANMAGHGHAVEMRRDASGREVRFDARRFPNRARAQAALDDLALDRGPIDFAAPTFEFDLQRIGADYLIEHVDLAFDAWRTKPWAQDVEFEVFCAYLLPYRHDVEPLGWWRRPMFEQFAHVPGTLDDPTSIVEASAAIRDVVASWIEYRDVYELHPTRQRFEEIMQRRAGGRADIRTLTAYALRANGLMIATDTTPWWTHAPGGGSWEVVLDAQGHVLASPEAIAADQQRPAKVFRRVFARQPESVGALMRDDEAVPAHLAGTHDLDVTSQYRVTSNVELPLTVPVPDDHRFAYLCVFNEGEWRSVHGGLIEGDRASFTRMARETMYLPTYYVDGTMIPAAPPFLLDTEGDARPQLALTESTFRVELTPRTSDTPSPRASVELATHPVLAVDPGRTYELLCWQEGEWVSQGRRAVRAQPVSFRAVPEGVLLWLVDVDGDRSERPFTIEDGVRRSW